MSAPAQRPASSAQQGKYRRHGPKTPPALANRCCAPFVFFDKKSGRCRAQFFRPDKNGRYHPALRNAGGSYVTKRAEIRPAMVSYVQACVDRGEIGADSNAAAYWLLGHSAEIIALRRPARRQKTKRGADYAAKIKASLALRPLCAKSRLSEASWGKAKGVLREQILANKTLTPSVRLIAMALLQRCSGESPDCFPGTKLIAADAGVGAESIRRHLMPALKASGIFLVITVPLLKGGRRNYYRPSFADVSESDNLSTSARGESDKLPARKRHIEGPESDNTSPSIRTSSITSSTTSSERAASARLGGALALDRGAQERDIATRLGTRGWDIVGLLPDAELEHLCDRQRSGTLDDATIGELRLRYAAP